MRKIILAIAAYLGLAATSLGQVPNFPQTLPPNTVVGRSATGPGPSQALPFATLATYFTANAYFRVPVSSDATIFYIGLTGSDTTNNCVNPLSPCATFVGAWNKAQRSYDFQGHVVNFVFKDAGTYTGCICANGSLVGQTDPTKIIVGGNTPNGSLYAIQPVGTQAVFTSSGPGLTIRYLTLSGFLSSNDTITVGDGSSLIIGQGVVIGDSTLGRADIQPAFGSFVNVTNGYEIRKTQNLKTATFSSAATTLTVNNNTGILVGDVVTEVTNSSVPVGAAIYSRIPPFLTVSNIAGTTITLSGNTVASDGGAAKNVNFTRPSAAHIQADQKVQVYYSQGGTTISAGGVLGYTAGFITLDHASHASTDQATWVSDSAAQIQANAPPFVIQNGATLSTGTDIGSGPNLSSLPGVVLSISGTVTQGSNTVSGISAADIASVNQYFTKFGGTTGYRGLMVSDDAGRIRPATVIPAAGNVNVGGTAFAMSWPGENSTGTSTIKVGGFAWNGAIYLGTHSTPLAFGSAAGMAATSFVQTSAANNFTALQTFSGGLALSGAITPPLITADQNNYAPTGCAAANIIRLSSDATRTITGLGCGGSNPLMLWNIGANNIILSNQNASSSAVNRFLLGTDITLVPDSGLTVEYDVTTQRFRPWSLPLWPVARGGTGAITLTNHGVLLGQGTGAVVATAAMTNGQHIVGSTGADPVVTSSPTVATAITPVGAGGATLGTVALPWSDVFIKSTGLIDWANGNYKLTHSTDNLTFNGSGSTTNFQVGTVASSVNYMRVVGNSAGNFPSFNAAGSDTNIGFFFISKGTGAIQFLSNSAANNLFNLTPVASAVNYATFTSAATGNAPSLAATGSDTNISLSVAGQGTGIVRLGQTLCTVTGATPQTCNGQRGIVTTGTLTTAAVTAATYVINNSSVATSSLVQCNIQDYSGTWVTNGMPIIGEQVPGAGTITMQLVNTHATNALNGTLAIGCVVFN